LSLAAAVAILCINPDVEAAMVLAARTSLKTRLRQQLAVWFLAASPPMTSSRGELLPV
jgi:hypothetical protein